MNQPSQYEELERDRKKMHGSGMQNSSGYRILDDEIARREAHLQTEQKKETLVLQCPYCLARCLATEQMPHSENCKDWGFN